MFIVKILDFDTFLRENRNMNRYSWDRAQTYTTWDNNVPYQNEVRQRYREEVEAWFTQDINMARLFETEKSARMAANKGPFKFIVHEVDVQVTMK